MKFPYRIVRVRQPGMLRVPLVGERKTIHARSADPLIILELLKKYQRKGGHFGDPPGEPA